MEEALRALLLADSGVTALAGTRVNWGSHPQGAALPGVVLHLVSDVGDHTIDAVAGVGSARVQADCWATTIGAAFALGRAVRACLDGHRDDNFQGIFFAASRSGREPGADTADRPFFTSLDFHVRYPLT